MPVPCSSVPFARDSQFYKRNYTFEPDEFGLVISPVHSLQFGSDLWKVWWIWHDLWGSVDCLKTPERNFQDLRHSFFCGLPEKATLSWHEREGSFSNYSSHVVTRSGSLVQNHENWRDNLHGSWNKQLHSTVCRLWYRRSKKIISLLLSRILWKSFSKPYVFLEINVISKMWEKHGAKLVCWGETMTRPSLCTN